MPQGGRESEDDERPAGAGALWEAFTNVPGIGVGISTLDGRIISCNRELSQFFLDRNPDQVVGRNLAEFYPSDWMAERLDVYRRVQATGRPLAVRTIWKGRQVQTTFFPLHSGEGAVDRVLVVNRIDRSTGSPSGLETVESESADFGELDVLTPRELEVLALLGQGLRIGEIARALHRSEKTVENHRASIGRKLRETDRLRLAQIAADAGLNVRDAARRRVRRSSR